MAWKIAYPASQSGKICAFCKYWYDPTNSAIRPKHIRSGVWEYEATVKRDCMKCRFKRTSWQRCSHFESKLLGE